MNTYRIPLRQPSVPLELLDKFNSLFVLLWMEKHVSKCRSEPDDVDDAGERGEERERERERERIINIH